MERKNKMKKNPFTVQPSSLRSPDDNMMTKIRSMRRHHPGEHGSDLKGFPEIDGRAPPVGRETHPFEGKVQIAGEHRPDDADRIRSAPDQLYW